MPPTTTQGREYWIALRRKTRWRFWVYLLIAIGGTVVFVRSFPPRDPYSFAVLLLIPLLALRQAWRSDRRIALCDRQLPIIKQSKENQ
jgi:apolipoprotein N-acyltransferase